MIRRRSYYEDSSSESRQPRPSLAGRLDCEICVIGGGWTGLSVALHLAEHGRDVVLVEAGRIGAGASGHSGGQMIRGYALDLPDLIEAVGEDKARRMWNLAEQGRHRLVETIGRYGIDCGLRHGFLYAALTPRQMAMMRRLAATMESVGAHVEVIQGKHLARQLCSGTYMGALRDEDAGYLHPLAWALGLARAAESQGARLFEDSAVGGLSEEGRPIVHCRNGTIRARQVVVCANAWTPDLLPTHRGRLVRIDARMIASQPLDPALTIPSRAAVCDANAAMDYYRLSEDDRLLFGSAAAGRQANLEAAARSLAARAARLFPHLPELRAEYVWEAPVALTANSLPCVGRTEGGVWYAVGFSGHGVILTHLAGRLLGEAILGREGGLRLLAGDCPALAGGPLRRPLFMLGFLWRRLRDLVV